jgi:glycosyltransferase involved in cell wall biosynthesis
MEPSTKESLAADLPKDKGGLYLSLGIFAWNEEVAIRATLESLFKQSLFGELSLRNSSCEVVCVANGCTDRTAEVAEEVFARQRSGHLFVETLSLRVVNIPERGKNNAWNQFVHKFSAPEASMLFMMDADIHLHRLETLWRMVQTLEGGPESNIVVDRPCKHLAFKRRKSLMERLSLGAAQTTLAGEGQLCAQLYGIRTQTARNIYLPKDLAACEDGFVKCLACTDFLTHEVWSQRIAKADSAEHTFEAYTSINSLLKNQKRQALGQAIVHVLVDRELKSWPLDQRLRMAETLRAKDAGDPEWLKRLLAQHLSRARFFWRLYPGLLKQRFRWLSKLSWSKRLLSLPAAVAGSFGSLLGAWLAFRALKKGCTDYWPKAQRLGFERALLPNDLIQPKTLAKTGE